MPHKAMPFVGAAFVILQYNHEPPRETVRPPGLPEFAPTHLSTMTLHDFDAIRPLSPEELPEAFDQLLADPQFCGILQMLFKDIPLDILKAKLYTCKTNLDVQKTFLYPLIKDLLSKCSTGITMDDSAIAPEKRGEAYTYVSNHRDIVLDSALLNVQMIEKGYPETAEIAIGDNLLVYPWIRTLVRLNKSFIVQRSVGLREMLASSKRMSEYMHFALNHLHESIWIAQREGRAKDSNDRTQESVLKMMAMGGEGTPFERLKDMNIVPLSISYEYDPCDFLKAKEFQQKRDDENFRKSPQDDLTNMQTGIFGFKGRIVYRHAAPINTWIDELADLSKAQFFGEVARRMDHAIHLGYEMFPNNYVALDLLRDSNAMEAHYTPEQKAQFESYLEERIQMVDLPQKDEAFLRERILTMYANPLINQLEAQAAR